MLAQHTRRFLRRSSNELAARLFSVRLIYSALLSAISSEIFSSEITWREGRRRSLISSRKYLRSRFKCWRGSVGYPIYQRTFDKEIHTSDIEAYISLRTLLHSTDNFLTHRRTGVLGYCPRETEHFVVSSRTVRWQLKNHYAAEDNARMQLPARSIVPQIKHCDCSSRLFAVFRVHRASWISRRYSCDRSELLIAK